MASFCCGAGKVNYLQIITLTGLTFGKKQALTRLQGRQDILFLIRAIISAPNANCVFTSELRDGYWQTVSLQDCWTLTGSRGPQASTVKAKGLEAILPDLQISI